MRLLTHLAAAVAVVLALGAGPPPSEVEEIEAQARRSYEAGSPEAMEAAERLFARALALREAQGEREPGPLATLLHDLSGVAFNRGDYARAEEYERRALAIRERIYPEGDTRTAESRRDLGLVFLAEGRLQEASSHLVGAMQAIEAAPSRDKVQIAVGRNYLAELYRLQGRYDDAAAVLEGIVRPSPESLGEDHPHFPYFLNNLAGVYRDQERFDEAESLLRRSLALRRAALPRDDSAIARATLNIAELYRVQRKLAEAEPLYLEALDLARKTLGPDSPELFEFINQLAVLYRDQERLAEAEGRLAEALKLAEGGFGPDHPRVAQSRLDLAETLRARGRCDAALPHYARAVEIRETTLGASHPDVAEVLAARAACESLRRETRGAARADLDRALAILGTSDAHRAVAVQALAQRAELERAEDRPRARRDLGEALAEVERMRPHRGGGESVRAEFFGRHRKLYERMIRWEIEDRRPVPALLVAERARARVLLDQLAAAHVGEARSSDTDLALREKRSRAELAEVRERLGFEQARKDLADTERLRRIRSLETRLDAASRAFRELWDETRNASPAWRGAVASAESTLDDIQADAVPKDGLLLVYAVLGDGSFVFVVPPPPGTVEVIALEVSARDAPALGVPAGPLSADRLSRIVLGAQGLLARLASPRGSVARGIGGLDRLDGLEGIEKGASPVENALHALWRVLVPPALWSRVARAADVVVVPDGALYLLPLEALVVEPGPGPRETRFWLDAGPPVRYAPSASFLRQLRKRESSAEETAGAHAALSVSDAVYDDGGKGYAWAGAGGRLARLPGTAKETREVRAALAGVAEVVVLEGRQAREPAVRREMAGKRYVHVATHGLVDEEHGDLFAALALTPPPGGPPAGEDDGVLQLFEIYELPMDCELAVLSACGSNTGRVVAGEGVFALSRGFLVAGARRVVASQWSVDDASTAELVGELFRRIAADERAGRRTVAARALRDAKRRVRGKPEWAHPFFWAPFVLTGLE